MSAKEFPVVQHNRRSFLCVPTMSLPFPSTLIDFISNAQTDGFNLGESLSAYYPLLEIIFSFLDRNDLKNAKLVNLVWNAAANKELQRRVQLAWMEIVGRPFMLRASSNFNFSNAVLGIFIYRSSFFKRKKICLHKSTGLCKLHFLRYINQEVVCKNYEYLMVDNALDFLSPSLGLCENSFRPSTLQSILLPKIPKINIKLVRVHDGNSIKFKEENENVRCIVVYASRRSIRHFEEFQRELNSSIPDCSAALGGGIVTNTSHLCSASKKFTSSLFSCIVLSQEAGEETEFDSFSQIIRINARNFESIVVEFKNRLNFRENGIVFVFCCCENRNKHAINAIVKHFPRYRVLYQKMYGEIGWNFDKDTNVSTDTSLSTPPSAKKLKRSNSPERIFHNFTISLVLITWGRHLEQKNVFEQ